ncbi:PREDICTED: uncharacterized protein LOC102239477 [Myotis brandtii]|uniref:uncharacterized protein LOC102239477 n=1 Tax=Myotis brandtii TaxID=109478 RepID=UPI0003BBD021|nr:PREDICTED: uncharacterized protein LOC102239477 [Myotis brandtii]
MEIGAAIEPLVVLNAPPPPPGLGSEESEQKVLPLSRIKGCQGGSWGDFSRSGSHSSHPGFVSWAGVGVKRKIPVGFRKGFPSRAKSEPGDRASHISPSASASSPLPAPPLIFFFLSFNLISSNSTFVVNRRHAGISQSSPRNRLVKKTGPALGKQATGAAPTPVLPSTPPSAGSPEGSLAPWPLRASRSGAAFAEASRTPAPCGPEIERPGRRPRSTLPLQAAVVVGLSLPSSEEGLLGRREPEDGRTPGSNRRAYGLGHSIGGSHCSCSQAASLPPTPTRLQPTSPPAGSPAPLDSPLAHSLLHPHKTASAAVVIPLVSWEE